MSLNDEPDFFETWPDDDYYNNDDCEELDEWEEALQECGMDRDGFCHLGGTEHCDFECPFRDLDLDEDSDVWEDELIE